MDVDSGLMSLRRDGYFGMHCWNGLSPAQQTRLVEVGNLPFGFQPEGTCPRPAECEVETVFDTSPGPRFYCLPCAVTYLARLTIAHAEYRRPDVRHNLRRR